MCSVPAPLLVRFLHKKVRIRVSANMIHEHMLKMLQMNPRSVRGGRGGWL